MPSSEAKPNATAWFGAKLYFGYSLVLASEYTSAHGTRSRDRDLMLRGEFCGHRRLGKVVIGDWGSVIHMKYVDYEYYENRDKCPEPLYAGGSTTYRQ